MNLLWLTDIHLNFLEENKKMSFYRELIATDSDGVVISSDIAEATSVKRILKEMASPPKKPIYFVLGNHDYYRGNINDLHNKMTFITRDDPFLFWLPV